MPKRKRRTSEEKLEGERQVKLARNAAGLASIVNASFYGVSRFRGDHWILNEDELFEFSNTATVAIDNALPDDYRKLYDEYLKKLAPITAFGITAALIINQRLQIDKEIKSQKEASRNLGNGSTG